MRELRLGDSTFNLEGELGRGGMARVWLAARRGAAGFNRRVVLKEMLHAGEAKPERLDRFLREAALLSTLRHPNVVEVLEVGESEGVHFMVMEYVPGRDLRSIIEQLEGTDQAAPAGVAATIGVAIADALTLAHDFIGSDGTRHRIIHRDVSPENILIGTHGEVKLLDFGVAKDLDLASLTQAGDLIGKPLYMPPEAFAGESPTPMWDIYGLGVVLYRLLAGRSPFVLPQQSGGVMALIKAITDQEPPPLVELNPAVPPALAEIVAHAMAKDPRQRYSAASALHRDLKEWLFTLPPDAPREPRALLTGLGTPTADATAPAASGPAPGFSARTVTAAASLEDGGTAASAHDAGFEPPRTARRRLTRRELGLIAAVLLALGVAIAWHNRTRPVPGPPPPKPVAAPAPAAPQGTLVVRCSTWGYVKVDGKTVGTCPVPKLRVAAGKHRVSIEERKQERVLEVEVLAGQETVADLRPGVPPVEETLPPR